MKLINLVVIGLFFNLSPMAKAAEFCVIDPDFLPGNFSFADNNLLMKRGAWEIQT